MEKTTYKELKNYIHNELGLSKEDIREMIEETVQKELTHYLQQTFKASNLEYYLKNAINERVNSILDSHDFSSRLASLVFDNLKIDLHSK